MRLSDVWFTALSENESGQMITVYGRDELNEFTESGKFKERVEITWKYEGDGRGLPSDDLGEKMEAVEEALRKAMEKKDKLAILTGVYANIRVGLYRYTCGAMPTYAQSTAHSFISYISLYSSQSGSISV